MLHACDFLPLAEGCRSSWRWELILPAMSMRSINTGFGLPRCVRINFEACDRNAKMKARTAEGSQRDSLPKF